MFESYICIKITKIICNTVQIIMQHRLPWHYTCVYLKVGIIKKQCWHTFHTQYACMHTHAFLHIHQTEHIKTFMQTELHYIRTCHETLHSTEWYAQNIKHKNAMSVNITSTHPLMTKKQFLVSSRKEAMVVRDSLKNCCHFLWLYWQLICIGSNNWVNAAKNNFRFDM